MKKQQKNIILFDGVCNLCSHFVQFVIKHDSKNVFTFASLQSETGKKLLASFGMEDNYLQTVVMIENNKIYTQSTAALRISRRLNGAWNLLYAFIIIPKSFRDMAYRWIAKNRYRWFGKNEMCMIPTPELQAKFI